jgi:sugar lactone lactonase YvrE
MNYLRKGLCTLILAAFLGCNDEQPQDSPVNLAVNFQHRTTLKVGGEGAAEITAYDTRSKKLFIVNVEKKEISVYDISDLNAPKQKNSIPIGNGAPNSVSCANGKLAVAIENTVKQNNGKVHIYDAATQNLEQSYTVGALPDMLSFSKDGKLLLCANEGEPNKDYTQDPEGSVSIINTASKTVKTLDFKSFNSQLSSLQSKGLRVFGPNATLAQDVEPEYIAIADDGKTAWVSLQENNAIAKVNLTSQTIEALYPLGFKDYSLEKNYIDPSDKDGKKELRKVPVFGMYQPDAICTVTIKGTQYLISANEGDSREYEGTPGYVGETRVKKLRLDPTAFPSSEDWQNEAKIGRLKIAKDLGDTDNDGDYDALYSYGARSFSVWSENGNLLYDSGNSIAKELMARSADRFNDNDKRSDDKGAEPESVAVLNIKDQRYLLFVGLERTDQVLVYDLTTPTNPKFLDILSHSGDEAPEGILTLTADESPSGKELVIIANEDSGTVSIFENIASN